VYGADRPGIVAGVTGALAGAGANIIDLETQVIGAEAEPIYAMLIELATDAPGAVADAVAGACADLGVDHTLRAVDTETY
jgi:glycine cleavage system transcriptional repressor